MELKDRAVYKAKWIIRKYRDDEAYRRDEPYEVSEVDGNLLLNEGIALLQKFITGTDASGDIPWDNANARIGVGDGTTAEDATQTGLQGTNKAFKGMEAGYPQISGNTTTWRAVFGGTEANFSWQEFTIVNGADDTGVNLNRKVSNQGTRPQGRPGQWIFRSPGADRRWMW